MNIHKNARLTPRGRERIVRMAADGLAPARIAVSVGVSLKTVHKWIQRFAAEGLAGLADRSSRPHRLHRPTSGDTIEQIIALRRHKLSGKAIARQMSVSPATVSRILRRARLSRMRDLEPSEPPMWWQASGSSRLSTVPPARSSSRSCHPPRHDTNAAGST